MPPSLLARWRSNLISLKYRDKFGNRIFQYCLARILAEAHKCNLACEPLPYFVNAIKIENRKIIKEPTIRLKKHRIDFDNAIKTPAHYILHGWFQRYEYYADYKNLIQSCLAIDANKDLAAMRINPDDMVIHLRQTDMTNIDYRYLPIAIKEYKTKGRIFLVTDDCNSLLARQLINDYNMIVYSKSEIDDWTFIKGFSTIILGCSTYSWWAAYLSNAHTIVYPQTGYFATLRTNLFVHNEPRYKLLKF